MPKTVDVKDYNNIVDQYNELLKEYDVILKQAVSLQEQLEDLIKKKNDGERIAAEWTEEDTARSKAHPGWIYIKPYSNILQTMGNKHKNFIPSLLEAFDAEDELRNIKGNSSHIKEFPASCNNSTQTDPIEEIVKVNFAVPSVPPLLINVSTETNPILIQSISTQTIVNQKEIMTQTDFISTPSVKLTYSPLKFDVSIQTETTYTSDDNLVPSLNIVKTTNVSTQSNVQIKDIDVQVNNVDFSETLNDPPVKRHVITQVSPRTRTVGTQILLQDYEPFRPNNRPNTKVNTASKNEPYVGTIPKVISSSKNKVNSPRSDSDKENGHHVQKRYRPNESKDNETIPSLLNSKVSAPANLKSSTLNWLKADSRLGCWNCKAIDHFYDNCDQIKFNIFCFGCGLPNYRIDQCPNCSDAHKRKRGQ